jgi:hypothetical protein
MTESKIFFKISSGQKDGLTENHQMKQEEPHVLLAALKPHCGVSGACGLLMSGQLVTSACTEHRPSAALAAG